MSDQSTGDTEQVSTPGLYPGVNRETCRIFCRKVYVCGYCGNRFSAFWENGRRPCPQCRSFRTDSDQPDPDA